MDFKPLQIAQRFTHNCESCKYLGRADYYDPTFGIWREADLHYCAHADASMGGTVLARYGNEPGDYGSAPVRIALTYEAPYATYGLALRMGAELLQWRNKAEHGVSKNG